MSTFLMMRVWDIMGMGGMGGLKRPFFLLGARLKIRVFFKKYSLFSGMIRSSVY
jgi:hypothetical protein